jgi:hypothetical protein
MFPTPCSSSLRRSRALRRRPGRCAETTTSPIGTESKSGAMGGAGSGVGGSGVGGAGGGGANGSPGNGNGSGSGPGGRYRGFGGTKGPGHCQSGPSNGSRGPGIGRRSSSPGIGKGIGSATILATVSSNIEWCGAFLFLLRIENEVSPRIRPGPDSPRSTGSGARRSGRGFHRAVLAPGPRFSRDAKPGHGANRFHLRRIFRRRAIFRFMAALPFPAFAVVRRFRRFGAADFFAFFRRRRLPPPPLVAPRPNAACCAGVS